MSRTCRFTSSAPTTTRVERREHVNPFLRSSAWSEEPVTLHSASRALPSVTPVPLHVACLAVPSPRPRSSDVTRSETHPGHCSSAHPSRNAGSDRSSARAVDQSAKDEGRREDRRQQQAVRRGLLCDGHLQRVRRDSEGVVDDGCRLVRDRVPQRRIRGMRRSSRSRSDRISSSGRRRRRCRSGSASTCEHRTAASRTRTC